MKFLKRLKKFIKLYHFGFFNICRKISKEKRVGIKDAMSEVLLAKQYHCNCRDYYNKGIYKLRVKYRMKKLKEIDRSYLIVEATRQTKKSKKDINKLINYLEIIYFIDYKQFFLKKFYLLTKANCDKKIERNRKIVAIDIADIMKISIDNALERMIRVCNELEISYITYYEKKYYKKHEMDILTVLPWRKEYSYELGNIVAKETGNSYEEEFWRMDFIKRRYGILYSTYILRMYYMLTEREIVNDLTDYVQLVSDETGWTYNEASAKMNTARKKYGISNSRYCYCRYYTMDEQEAYEAELEYKNDRYKTICDYATSNEISIRNLYEDMRLHCICYGDPEDYYFAKDFYKIDNVHKNKYLHGRDGDYILPRKYNTKEGYDLLFNKIEFNKLFSKQLGRKWWINYEDNSMESFFSFASELDEIFVKPIEASRGRGCRKIKIVKDELENIYLGLIHSNEKLIVEECIKPHKTLSQFGGGSVSSIRIIALYANEKCNVITAYLRVGNGAVTDNISIDGVAIEINVNTGITSSHGINKNGDVFIQDNFSGAKFKNIDIPFWDETMELVKETMEKLKGKVGYAGLDIAITPNGPVLIEANSHAHLHRIEFFQNNKNGNRNIIEDYV